MFSSALVSLHSWCTLARFPGWGEAPLCPSPCSFKNLEIATPSCQMTYTPSLRGPVQHLPLALLSALGLLGDLLEYFTRGTLESCVCISWVSPYRVKSSLMSMKGPGSAPFRHGMLVWSCSASGSINPHP